MKSYHFLCPKYHVLVEKYIENYYLDINALIYSSAMKKLTLKHQYIEINWVFHCKFHHMQASNAHIKPH